MEVGKSKVNCDGMFLDIDNGNVKVKGSVLFGRFAPLKYNAMGPFKYFPLMECKHRVVSMRHGVSGKILINENEFNFENASGYIEGDYGRSFPKKYFWTQCDFSNPDLSVMASCARIPYLGLRFTGTICIIRLCGKEFRLATYLGARAEVFGKDRLVIKQGKKLLDIRVLDTGKNARKLRAPVKGRMDRTIKESIKSSVSYKFSVKGKTIFDITSDCAAVEAEG